MKLVRTERVDLGVPDKRKASSRAAHGRRCADAGCATILSTYNTATTCWLHSQPVPRHALFAD